MGFKLSGLFPEQMYKKCTDYDGKQIDSNSGAVSKQQGNVPEYFLRHAVMGADVKHVDAPMGVKYEIQ